MRGYFFVYKRTLKSGKKVYYYQTYKPDGTLSSGKSTGCRTKSAAIHYCETLLMQGRIWSGTNITFANYAEHFFDSEINSLRKENVMETYIDLKDQYLRGELRPLKTKEARKVPICPELHKLLSDRISHQ